MRSDFNIVELRDLVQVDRPITYGIVQPGEFVADGIPLVRGGDYSAGWSPLSEIKRVRPEVDRPYSRSRLKTGDLVVTIVGANTGKVAAVPKYLEGANITQTTARVAIDAAKASPDYVLQYFKSAIAAREVYQNIKGGAQPGLNLSDLELFRVPVPSLPVQRCIAEILRTWDEVIEKIERLIATKHRLFMNHREELAWCRRGNRVAQLSELLVQSSDRVGPGRSLRVFSVTKDGLVPQDEHFNKRIANEDVSRHMLVEQGDFAFSGLNFWLGSVDVSLEPEPFCISPDYKVFKIGQDVVPGFFRHMVRTDHFRQILRSCAVERASVVRKNLDRETFLASEIPLPDRGRQEAVLNMLSAAEHELFLLRRQLDAIAQQKRGLMQKLLTGEWPVTVFESQEAAE